MCPVISQVCFRLPCASAPSHGQKSGQRCPLAPRTLGKGELNVSKDQAGSASLIASRTINVDAGLKGHVVGLMAQTSNAPVIQVVLCGPRVKVGTYADI